ncbi:anti-anti-sigma factor [Actinacidiphila paucisporea]|uniref:Anti-anti-sigma factor n=2 Tax=Actinacidiphila paucisporea TaxID=310782 RepID=A0A1M7NQB1_9ACTN|nr:anti-anti-sigma factor [Actinacidiphila paucisporea]
MPHRESAQTAVPVIAPYGDLDVDNLEPLAARLKAAAATSPAVVLDARAITFGDSSFLRVLITVHRLTELRIAAPRPALQKLLELVGVDRLFPIYPSVESARSAPAPAAGR